MWLRGIRCTFGNSLLDDANVVHAGYFKAISKIAQQERAKLYIPVSAPTTAIYDSLTQDVLPKDCVCWTLPPHLTGLLDDKTAFTDLCDKVSRSVMCELACIRHAVLQAPARQALLNLNWLLQCFLSRALSISAQALPPFLPSPLPTHSFSLPHDPPSTPFSLPLQTPVSAYLRRCSHHAAVADGIVFRLGCKCQAASEWSPHSRCAT